VNLLEPKKWFKILKLEHFDGQNQKTINFIHILQKNCKTGSRLNIEC